MSFKIEVTEIKEHEDGSATLTFEMNEDTKKLLINYAIADIIRKSLEGDENA